MLFLGSVDDKSIQYPNGGRSQPPNIVERTVLVNLLFNHKPLLVEEGFILASAEALDPENSSPIYLPAIKHGLIKVISRNGDMANYAKARRKVKHVAPPDNQAGNTYLRLLQQACENTENYYDGNAFLTYPQSKIIDEFTYYRLRSMCDNDEIAGLMDGINLALPHTFLDEYERCYRSGNDGQQWTARAAWEKTAMHYYSAQPHIVHFLMIKANRERQIIRAAASAYVNNIAISVETGFDPLPHDFATPSGDAPQKQPLRRSLPAPAVNIDDLVANAKTLFAAISDPKTNLFHSRNTYLQMISKPINQIDANALSTASRRYEEDLYKDGIKKTPLENSVVRPALELGSGYIIGAAAEKLLSETYAGLSKDPSRLNEKHDLQLLQSKVSRRTLFAMIGAATVFGWGYLNSKISDSTRTALRSGRIAMEDSTYETLLEAMMQSGAKQQFLDVDAQTAAHMIGL
ncbi:hypothetical protein LJ739_10230 [Aestuariibacter halophilus]|uniref:Uncharacterized protein n=1 Tax=Fluctibacter halophilus TaxID=226011 RepID=A0ABS8G7Q5_9ALTE|nr:hypothetical protein [Aestuariibacter halophilus]MCC2616619.1 hypothetical protein [Aestuariibacter halophilus]